MQLGQAKLYPSFLPVLPALKRRQHAVRLEAAQKAIRGIKPPTTSIAPCI